MQLQLGESVSIYSEKAYRKNNGKVFEAIGSVVIISGRDTLYGQRASLNTETGEVFVEGSVRLVSEKITIYGSRIDYNIRNNQLEIVNARIITSEFNINASNIRKQSETIYIAEEAEFTTCRDCRESWTIYGQNIELEIERYLKVKHALLKVKGVDVLYLPYLVLPVKNKRESGLLFPALKSNERDGVIYEQPFFWAISSSSDMTITPTFQGERGQGFDFEYRHVYGEKKWVEFSNKMILDRKYRPLDLEDKVRPGSYFRHFYSFENHYQFSPSFLTHTHILGAKDLDLLGHFSDFTDDHIDNSDIGLETFVEKKFESFDIGVEANYKRNLLVSDPEQIDKSYVQIQPKFYFNVSPQVFWQRDSDYFYRMTTGISSELVQFKQLERDDDFKKYSSGSTFYRNLNRFSSIPYLKANILNKGPFNVESKIQLDYQEYRLIDSEESNFYKHATLVTTKASFSLDRIFGLSYEEVYQVDDFEKKDLQKINTNNATKVQLEGNLIGSLETFESSNNKETIKVSRNSYRHSQEFNFIHHRIVSSSENGNSDFGDQIKNENGWFDDIDAIREEQEEVGSNETRTIIPLKNTFEFQWNNILIKKTPKTLNYLVDNKYLKDNFEYSRIGHFNLSQGLILDEESNQFTDRLTRLYVDTGYSAKSWSVGFHEYLFHQSGDYILKLNASKRFSKINLLSSYSENTFENSNIKTLKNGFQIRPFDSLGFSYLQEHDLFSDDNIYSIYQVDFMPDNNCWIMNLNYKEGLLEKRFALNFEFNYGNDEFKQYRRSFWSFNRLQ